MYGKYSQKSKKLNAQADFMNKIKNLKPGNHLCCLYKTEEEHRKLLTPFLRHGLERGEKVFYIVDSHTSKSILNYLRKDGLEVESYLRSGQLNILNVDNAYMREGIFDPDRMITLLRSETKLAISEGYSALRVTGEMTWALKDLSGSEKLIEYESKLNTFFPRSKCMAICQYDQRRFDPKILLDVLLTHPIAIIGMEIYDNFYYMPPKELLGPDLTILHHWMKNLSKYKKIEEERIQLSNLEAINNLIVTINHEMNQPLSVITLYSSHLMKDAKKDNQTYKDAKLINDEAWKLAELVKKISKLKELKTTEYSKGVKMVDLSDIDEREENERQKDIGSG